jgi:hypothetical protein
MDIPLKDVPVNVRRHAARHLESLRDTDLLRGTEDAVLGDSAVPVYRPDLDSVAYYEIPIIRGRSGKQVLLSRNGLVAPALLAERVRKNDRAETAAKNPSATPIGFIIASAGRHDFPIAHWSLNRIPPSQQVLAGKPCKCDDDDDGGASDAPVRLYKLDALSYVAEDAKQRMTGVSGQMPTLITGLPPSLEKFACAISSSHAKPLRSLDDHDAEKAEYDEDRSDRESPGLSTEPQDDWPTYKKRYAVAFAPMLVHLKERASRVWDIDDAIGTFGEGILTGTRHRVALLDDAKIELGGEGVRHVDARIEENPGGAPTLVIDAKPLSLQQEIDLTVSAHYANGESEKLRFFIVSRDTPTNARTDKTHPCCSDCED